jgi:2-alkyl-3-oxoalkanoate reductase
MLVFITGGTGVLGRSLLPLLKVAGHDIRAPSRRDLDLFDPQAVRAVVRDTDAIYHLATRIPSVQQRRERDAWGENDRLRAEASRLLVDAALASSTEVYVQPTVAFVYPPQRDVDEDTPIEHVGLRLESSLAAEREADRFAASGRRGVVLRLGLLDGPGTGNNVPDPSFGATLNGADAGRALLAALDAPTGVYNVVRDGERVSNARFKRATGWRPEN